ncbi:MAG: hypothetical protein ACLT38_08835 [Akkermansia sp.]
MKQLSESAPAGKWQAGTGGGIAPEPRIVGEKIVLPNDGFDLLGSIRCDAVNDQILIACDEKISLMVGLFHEKRF